MKDVPRTISKKKLTCDAEKLQRHLHDEKLKDSMISTKPPALYGLCNFHAQIVELQSLHPTLIQ